LMHKEKNNGKIYYSFLDTFFLPLSSQRPQRNEIHKIKK
jgi:hypothetical protein